MAQLASLLIIGLQYLKNELLNPIFAVKLFKSRGVSWNPANSVNSLGLKPTYANPFIVFLTIVELLGFLKATIWFRSDGRISFIF